jgi:hypothetical protein
MGFKRHYANTAGASIDDFVPGATADMEYEFEYDPLDRTEVVHIRADGVSPRQVAYMSTTMRVGWRG